MRRLILCLVLALPALAADVKLDDLAWMSGHWGATIDEREMEEVWLAPSGGVMTGMHRDVKNGRAFFEFLRIAVTPTGIVYLAQPAGRPPTPFPLVESSDHRVVFANPQHDFPQRILYELRDGQLCARVEGPPDAEEKAEEWCWSKLSRGSWKDLKESIR